MSELRFLTCDELALITGKVKYSAQRHELALMGIPFRLNSKGAPVVHVDDVRPGRADIDKQPKGGFVPCWDAIRK